MSVHDGGSDRDGVGHAHYVPTEPYGSLVSRCVERTFCFSKLAMVVTSLVVLGVVFWTARQVFIGSAARHLTQGDCEHGPGHLARQTCAELAQLRSLRSTLFAPLEAAQLAASSGAKVAAIGTDSVADYTPQAAAQKSHTNWAIFTTIHQPTPAIWKSASLDGWCTLVAADLKTPSDWWANYMKGPEPPGCLVYLSVAAQNALGYNTVQYTPWKNYGRKNVAYVYAISHGAQMIYESDDDNILMYESLEPEPAQTTADKPMLTFNTTKQTAERGWMPVVNPYAYFGRPDVWPRGYPLEAINDALVLDSTSRAPPAVKCQHKAWIQQGLADGDPDVDAVYRLTRKVSGEKIVIRFDAKQPAVALPVGTFCPFNAQNTYWHYGAFWAMLLPVTVNFRVCDIWRAYFSARLLWELEGNPVLIFLRSTVYQDRNVHDYLVDYRDEYDLYNESGRLIAYLRTWKSDHPDFLHRVLQLYYDLALNGFWYQNDVLLLRGFLIDLIQAGYKPPALSSTPLHLERPDKLPMGQSCVVVKPAADAAAAPAAAPAAK